MDNHHLAPSPLADREPTRSGFQPYRPSPSDESRALPPHGHASPHAPQHAPHAPPPFSMDPAAHAAHNPLAYNPYALYPAQLHQAYR